MQSRMRFRVIASCSSRNGGPCLRCRRGSDAGQSGENAMASIMKAPPSTAFKIVDVPDPFRDLFSAKGVKGTFVGAEETESPWVPFGDKAAIKHLAFDVRNNVYSNILWMKG